MADAPDCPLCGLKMVMKQKPKRLRDGKPRQFWACQCYPFCPGYLPANRRGEVMKKYEGK
jgi:DNA-directed RNA polymerase subunit RPC12/RpoP